MGWLGRGLEGLRCTGEPVYELDGHNGYDGPHVRRVTITCEVADPPSLVPGTRCSHERFTRSGWTGRPTAIRDRRLELAPTFLMIERRRLHCRDCDSVLSERMPGVELGHEMTRRLYDDIFHAAVNRPYQDVANLHGVSADLVETIFREHARDLIGDFAPDLSEIVAIDETALAGQMRFVCNCLVSRTLVDILPDKKPVTVEHFLRQANRNGHVRVVVQDMNRDYRAAVRAALGHEVMIVVDRFHVVDALNRAMNASRVAVTARKKGPGVAAERASLRKIAPLLLRNRRELTRAEWAELKGILRSKPELQRAWMLKEALKGLYGFKDAEKASAQLDRIDKRYQGRWTGVMKPMGDALKMVKTFRVEILAWHQARQDNSFTEAMNNRYQLIDAGRAGVQFETVRAKALLRYGGLLDQWYLDRV